MDMVSHQHIRMHGAVMLVTRRLQTHAPVIMLNAKYDHFFPPETSQKPYFRLLGTPAADKKLVLHESGHFLLRSEVIGESLAWLDRYLGPVTR